MNRAKEIDAIYKILAIYEEIDNDKSDINIDSYTSYLYKLYVKWVGIGDAEMYNTLKGLYTLGKEATHRDVKSIVFDMIGRIEKGV